MKKELFVCDKCGAKKRLASTARHWCDQCSIGSPVELRAVRNPKAAEAVCQGALELADATPNRSRRRERPQQMVGLGGPPNQTFSNTLHA